MIYEVDEKVEANIGFQEDFWIQAVVLDTTEEFVRVREVDTDDEWDLEYDKIRKA